MVKRAIVSGAVLLAGWATWVAAGPRPASADAGATATTRPAATGDPGVAVVEAFVSQGCNYCPPAERLLAGVAEAARAKGRPVHLLVFHVDYFDNGGWTDRFGDAAYTARQRAYASTLGGGGPFTPQTVVNGATQFVGTDRAATDRAVAAALAAPAAVPVTATVTGSAKDGYHVRPNLTDAGVAAAGRDAVVAVAVVERGLSTDVAAGENAGAHLDEPSVVRWFGTAAASAADVPVAALPAVHADHASVVLFVQSKPAGPVLGAAAVPLP